MFHIYIYIYSLLPDCFIERKLFFLKNDDMQIFTLNIEAECTDISCFVLGNLRVNKLFNSP